MANQRKDVETPPDPAQAFALGHDGKIDGIYRPGDGRRTWTANDNARLELAERSEPAAPELPERPRAPRSSRKMIIVLAVLGAAIFILPLAGRWAFQVW